MLFFGKKNSTKKNIISNTEDSMCSLINSSCNVDLVFLILTGISYHFKLIDNEYILGDFQKTKKSNKFTKRSSSKNDLSSSSYSNRMNFIKIM